MSSKIIWPLADSPFTFFDKLKVSWWLTAQDRYTMGQKVTELEKRFSDLSSSNALMVANGSIANHLVFELWKVKNPDVIPTVIVPAVTWISSITPAMMAGMNIVFCDVNLQDFSFDYAALEATLNILWREGRRIIIWPTALIGWSPDMKRLHDLAHRYGADLFLDACENTLAPSSSPSGDTHILNSASMVTTSCYLSHYVCSVEGGFVFFKDRGDLDLGKMFRNHGMVRSLSANHPFRTDIESKNPTVDPLFLFALGGSNFRPSDVHAAFGLLDFERIAKITAHRKEIYDLFRSEINRGAYYLPRPTQYHIAFCLPIFTLGNNLKKIKTILAASGIETRPIIGSNLLRQPPFSKYGNPLDFPNAEWIHTHGCYVGLHNKVTPRMVKCLCNILNSNEFLRS